MSTTLRVLASAIFLTASAAPVAAQYYPQPQPNYGYGNGYGAPTNGGIVGDYFGLLGVPAQLGRLFTRDELRVGFDERPAALQIRHLRVDHGRPGHRRTPRDDLRARAGSA